jgi:hypothetical protein
MTPPLSTCRRLTKPCCDLSALSSGTGQTHYDETSDEKRAFVPVTPTPPVTCGERVGPSECCSPAIIVTAVVALVPDLMDRSRLDAASRAVGTPIVFVTGPSELPAAVRAIDASLVVVDLSAADALEAVASAGDIRTIGFCSHVERDLLRRARDAGCDEVMARSAMFRHLVELLSPRLDGQGST